MARVKDLWYVTEKKKTADGTVLTGKKQTPRHPGNGGSKTAKRWLAIWITPDGTEASRAFTTQDAAKKYGAKMEADAGRGEYIAPQAGRELFGDIARKHLRLRAVGASSRRKYESAFRVHVEPVFGTRPVGAIRPSEVLEWLRNLGKNRSVAIQEVCYLIVSGTFDLAVADGLRRDNPAKSPIVPKPRADPSQREAWDRSRVWQVIDEHSHEYRTVPACAAGLGLRQGCVFGLAEEDFDFDAGKVRICRQVTSDGGLKAFKAPKGGKERTVPLPRGLAAMVQAHIEAYPPQPYTLPWLGEDGKLNGEHECRLLFRWHGDDPRTHGKPIVSSSYDQAVWKPALSRAGIIPPPVKDHRGIHRYRGGDRHDGMHALRHFYSTTLLDAGVSLAGVMEFMGHSRKGKVVTLAVYGHVTDETYEQARQAIDSVLFRVRPVASAGTVAELRRAR